MQPVFGLVKDNEFGHSVTSSVTSWPRLAGRQCMNTHMARPGSHQGFVHLERLEDASPLLGFGFLAHTGPHIGVNGVGGRQTASRGSFVTITLPRQKRAPARRFLGSVRNHAGMRR